MDEAKLKRLIRMVEESDIEEIEIRKPLGGRIRITNKRGNDGVQMVAAPAPVMAAAPAPPSPEAAASPETPVKEERDPNLVAVVAPMVGTFYSAPAPGAKAYLAVGDHISVGQVVCIVEAMKLMNEVQSEISGVVREIRVENSQAVEYGQELFLVAPA